MKKLFVIDLDGTTLQSFTKMHPKVVEGVKHVRNLGHDVVIATGRNVCSALRFYDELGLDTPIITANGCHITNPKDNNFEDITKYLSCNVIKNVSSDNVKSLIRSMYYYKKDSIIMDEHSSYIDEMIFAMGCQPKTEKLCDQDDILAIAIMIDKDNVEDLKNELYNSHPELELNTWGMMTEFEFIEVNPVGVNKWDAIMNILDYVGVDEENVYTFGDEMNDFAMIKNCKNGVALHNSNDKIKDVASLVLDLSNEQGAVGEFLLQQEK